MATTVPSRRMASGAARTDWPGFVWIAPLRYAIVCAALVAFALTYASAAVALSLTIGALFAAVADPRGPFPRRLRSMGLATALITITAPVGVLVSGSVALHVAAAVVVAMICGYLGVAGPRAAVAGVVALVTFTIFSGTPEPIGAAPAVALWVLVGAAAQIAVLVGLRLLGRMEGMRTEIGIAYRSLGLALGDTRAGPTAVQAISRVAAARAAVSECDAEGATRAWLDDLVEHCDHARVGLLALRLERESLDQEGTRRVLAFDAAAARLCIAMADALQGTGRRSAIPGSREALRQAMPHDDALPRTVARLIDGIADDLAQAATMLEAPWPLGRRNRASFDLGISAEPVRRLLRRDDPEGLFRRHAIRLAILIGIATLLASLDPLEHSYWIPLTVAWVTKPDFAGTAVRIFSRIGGTILGLVTATLVLAAFGDIRVVAIGLIGASAFATFAFMQPNYAICTAGVTSYVLTLLYLDGDPLIDTALLRVLGTVVAAIAIWVAIRIRPVRMGEGVCLNLADQARALARYASAARTGDRTAMESTRADLVRRRAEADASIIATALEPGRHVIHDADARAVFDDLLEASGVVATVDLTGDDAARSELTEPAIASLADLGTRLASLHEDGHAPPRVSEPLRPETRFSRALDAAHGRLDVVATLPRTAR